MRRPGPSGGSQQAGQSNNHSISIKPAQALTPATAPPAAVAAAAGRMHAGLAGKGKRCLLLVWSVVLARSFRSSFFLSLHSTPTPTPPVHAGEGSQTRGGGKKGNRSSSSSSSQKGPLPTAHRFRSSPPSRSARVKASRAAGQGHSVGTLWRRHRVLGEGVRPGQGPRKKVLGANVGQSTYLHIRPAQPNPIQAVPRSFLSTSTFPVELELVLELAPHLTESEE